VSLRRNLLILIAVAGLWCFAAAPGAFAQTPSQHEAAEEQSEFPWHLVNSAIFAVGFAYAIWKYSPAFFNARSADIQKAIKDATGLKLEADFRHSEIDRKMATLPAEIKRLRDQIQLAIDREEQGRREETQRELRHIEDSLQAEIAASRDEGVRQIRRRAALLALQSAERQLEARAGSDSERLVGDFIHVVERGKN
jgi:F-type H+-transporting ATPase subunit b